jgi:hypothetical protein
MTDASDYGIGAYFYQVIDGVEKPIKFKSVSLYGAQLRWSVIKKEGYGVFYAIIHKEHLLGGRHLKGEDNPIADITSRQCPKLGDSLVGEYDQKTRKNPVLLCGETPQVQGNGENSGNFYPTFPYVSEDALGTQVY